jgi:hypothetical protein
MCEHVDVCAQIMHTPIHTYVLTHTHTGKLISLRQYNQNHKDKVNIFSNRAYSSSIIIKVSSLAMKYYFALPCRTIFVLFISNCPLYSNSALLRLERIKNTIFIESSIAENCTSMKQNTRIIPIA